VHTAAKPDVLYDLRQRGLLTPLALGGVAAAGCITIGLANPGDDGVPLCASRFLFGVDCAFCGGIRCTNSLLRGDFLAAADHNVLLAFALPVVAVTWVVMMVRGLRAPDPGVAAAAGDDPADSTWWVRRIPSQVSITAGVLLLGFGIVRNLDLTPWMVWLHSDTF
jgi:hypothetical protein